MNSTGTEISCDDSFPFALEPGVLGQHVFPKRLAEPDSLDDRIGGDNRQREHGSDDAPKRRPYSETKQYRDTRQLQMMAIHLWHDGAVFDHRTEPLGAAAICQQVECQDEGEERHRGGR